MFYSSEITPPDEPSHMLRGEQDLGEHVCMEYWIDPEDSKDWRIKLHTTKFPTTEEELLTLLEAFSTSQGQTLREALQAIRDFSEPYEEIEEI